MACFVHTTRLQDLTINKESVDKECQSLQQTIIELDATSQVKSICHSGKNLNIFILNRNEMHCYMYKTRLTPHPNCPLKFLQFKTLLLRNNKRKSGVGEGKQGDTCLAGNGACDWPTHHHKSCVPTLRLLLQTSFGPTCVP